MAKAGLTAAFVKAIKVGAGTKYPARTDFWDQKTHGFGLRVTESGVKSWTVFYNHNGQPRKLKVGSYPTLNLDDARKAAAAILKDATLGLDPATAKKQARVAAARALVVGTTFGDLAARALAHVKSQGKRSWATDERMINTDLAAWKDRPLEGINKVDRKDVGVVLAAIARRVAKRGGSGVIANRVLSLISGIFNLGIGWGVVDYNPAHLYPQPAKERVGQRVLTDAEIKALWRAVEAKPAKQSAFVKLCLLTAARPREVLGAALSEVDFELAEWTIPAARAKNGCEHVVPLTAQAMNLIAGIKNGSPYLFPMQQIKPRAMNTFRVWVDDLRDELKFEPDWVCRDLRRTASTGMARIGISHELVDRVLNHTIQSLGVKHYIKHAYINEKRDALMRWGAEVARIVA